MTKAIRLQSYFGLRVSEDKRSGIQRDPNRADDPEYIVRLVGHVVRVSMETVKIVEALPREYGG